MASSFGAGSLNHRASVLLSTLQIVLLLSLFAQLLLSAGLKSPTIDEPNHLTRGYAYLKTGDLRLSRIEGHPPLFNLVCALPLLLLDDLDLPVRSQNWIAGFRNAFATEFVFAGRIPVRRLFFLGRLPVMFATVCLAALTVRWASELYGPWGGLVSLCLCVFDPNLIAHGRLVTTDVGSTLFLLLSVYTFWRYARAPSVVRFLLSGVTLGLAQGIKFSAVLLLPVLGLLGLLVAFSGNSRELGTSSFTIGRPRWPRRAPPGKWVLVFLRLLVLGLVFVGMIAVAGLVVWAVYRFQISELEGWPIKVPAADYLHGLLDTLRHASATGHPAFLLGQRSTQGWWYYFPVAFVLKTPLPMLVILALAAVSNRWRRTSFSELPLLVFPILYFGFSMRSVLTIGYRHLLPMLPFLWIYVGRIARLGRRLHRVREKRAVQLGSLVLMTWLVVATLSVAPDYLAFFNVFAGGPDGGWRYLVDSNLDWGQELPAIERYLEQRQPLRPYLSWFGSTYPHLYGLDLEYRLLPSHLAFPYPADAARSSFNPAHPAPGLYIIGATNLQGVGLAAGDVFAEFRQTEPADRIAHSLFVFEVGEGQEDSNPTCISELRFRDLMPETTALTLGRGPGPVKWFNYSASFILPGQGEPIYVLPDQPLGFHPQWQAAFAERAQIVHRQTGEGHYPDAVAYRLDRDGARAWLAQVLASTTDVMSWSEAVVLDASASRYPIAAPAALDFGLELVSYEVLSGHTLRPGEALEMVTVWRATAEVPARATDLRIFVHLLDSQSQVWAAEDRLDLSPPTWEAGDVLLQYHRVALAPDAKPGQYELELGMYRAITMERLRVYEDGDPVADRLLLEPVEVVAR